jgi:thiamine biosynthesis protein ThiS
MALAVTVNGMATTCPSGYSVDQLLQKLQLPRDRVAVERNRQIVRRDQRESVGVEDGDVFEVVTFVGGG